MSDQSRLIPCSYLWTIELKDGIQIQHLQGHNSSKGTILVAKPPTKDSKIKGTPLKNHKYELSLAADGEERWIMPIAPTIEFAERKGENIVELSCDPSNNIITFKWERKDAEAFAVTPLPPKIEESNLDKLEPLPAKKPRKT
jgi:hypothetical protein